MESLKISGSISQLSGMQTYITKDGSEKHSRSMVITTDEQYPKSMFVQVKNDDLLSLPLEDGTRITAYLSPRIRTSKQGVIFNEINVWKIQFDN